MQVNNTGRNIRKPTTVGYKSPSTELLASSAAQGCLQQSPTTSPRPEPPVHAGVHQRGLPAIDEHQPRVGVQPQPGPDTKRHLLIFPVCTHSIDIVTAALSVHTAVGPSTCCT
jgi:hypothetical protein